MLRLHAFISALFAIALAAPAATVESLALDVDLSAQKARLLQDGKIVYEIPISSGRPGHATRTGNFSIIDKDADHRSSLYGRIVGADGKVIVPDADSDMPLPPGASFVQAPMKHFIRFDGATGLHAGYLPGYAASHGCVRLPAAKAALFFNILPIGTPVKVHGTAPPPPPVPERKAAAPVQATPVPRGTREPIKWLPFIKRKPAA